MANVIWVAAGAAKAAEAIAVTIAKTRKVFALNLPTKEYIERESELWDMSVIRFPLWLVTTARNFSTHGNLLQSAEPITRKLHRPNHRLAISLIRHVASWRSWKHESAIDAHIRRG